MFFSKSFALTVLLAVSVSVSVDASPARTRARRQDVPRSCVPNYEDVPVSVTCSAVEWGVDSSAVGSVLTSGASRGGGLVAPNFLFTPVRSQDGVDAFKISDVEFPDRFVTVNNATCSVPILELAEEADGNAQQLFQVVCKDCQKFAGSLGGPAATGCHVKPIGTDQCVSISKDRDQALHLVQCKEVADNLNFDMWTPGKVTPGEGETGEGETGEGEVDEDETAEA